MIDFLLGEPAPFDDFLGCNWTPGSQSNLFDTPVSGRCAACSLGRVKRVAIRSSRNAVFAV